MRLHIIIPCLNEADNLRKLLPRLLEGMPVGDRITLADGGSTDETSTLSLHYPKVNFLRCQHKGRAFQMNEAARIEIHRFDALYFVHADTLPPVGFRQDIYESITSSYPTGCYRFKFNRPSPFLSINAYFTRYRFLACRGGDQSLFVTTQVFERMKGFSERLIMEDYDFIERVWAAGISFRIIPKNIIVSARKYETNSYLRVQLANWKVFRMYRKGATDDAMLNKYHSMLTLP